jgi:hypothetical protein
MIHLTKQTGGIMAAAMATALMLSGASFVLPAQAEMQLAQAGQAPPPGATPAPPNTPPPAMTKPTRADQVEARIKSLHDQLQITPAQEAQWGVVAQSMRDSASKINALIQQRAQSAKTMGAVDDLQSYQAIAQAHADGLSSLVPAFDTLYASMSDAQKKNADAVFKKRPHGMTKKSG